MATYLVILGLADDVNDDVNDDAEVVRGLSRSAAMSAAATYLAHDEDDHAAAVDAVAGVWNDVDRDPGRTAWINDRPIVVVDRGALRAIIVPEPDGCCWHVTTANGDVYGAAAASAGDARRMVAERLAAEGSTDLPVDAEHVGAWDAAYGTVLHYS